MDITFDQQFFVSLLQIIWIDILLSGDNAVVIALACRSLPDNQRKWGIILGAGAAILLRVIFAIFIVYLLQVPYLKLIGGVLRVIVVGVLTTLLGLAFALPQAGEFGFVIFTIIVSHTTGSLGLSHSLEQKRVVAFFYPQDVTHVVLLQGLNMRGIRTEAIFGDDHLEMGVILTKLADETLGGVAPVNVHDRDIVDDERVEFMRQPQIIVGAQRPFA